MHIFVPSAADCALVTVYDSSIYSLKNCDVSGLGGISWVEKPDSADLIVLFEEWGTRFSEYADVLRSDPLIRGYGDRVITLNCDDLGRGHLPGLYTSLTSSNFDIRIHAACGYPYTYNELIDFEPSYPEVHAYLFSFQGTDGSHWVRKYLFKNFAGVPRGDLHLVNKAFHSHTRDDKRSYISRILGGKFGLCPRGWSPSTYRLFEVMELGRCPVIISDEWVPIQGIEWENCSIRIRYRELPNLVDILREREADAEALGAQARRIWLEYFSPERKFRYMLQCLLDLNSRRRLSLKDMMDLWSSRHFYKRNGWLLHQRMWTKAKLTLGLR